MSYAVRILGITGVVACTSLGGVTAANAVPITPDVESWTAAAVTSGSVPDPSEPIFGVLSDFRVDVQPSPATQASVTLPVSAGGAETADGAAEATIDPVTFNLSVVRSRSSVATAGIPTPTPNAGQRMTDASAGALSATLSNPGLGLGESATVDLVLNVTGSLVYNDPTGLAGVPVCDPILIEIDPTLCDLLSPDISASVSVILALADVTPIALIPGLPVLSALFNGSVTLESVGGGAPPALDRVGDFDGLGDVTPVGTCTAFFCEMDVNLSLTFANVQALGFGDLFDVGLVLSTSADALSEAGRSVEADFFDTAFVRVTLTAVEAAAPAPGSLLLLATGLMGIAAARRVRRLR